MLAAIGFRCFLFLIRWTPLWLLYRISDLLSLLLQYLLRYRATTIRQNLQQAFPEKDQKELKRITRAAYKNLMDTTLESLKGPFLSSEELKRRMHFSNPEIIPKDKHVLLIGGHQGNWEWGGLAVTLWFEQAVAGVYKKLKNKNIDLHFRSVRSKRGLQLLSLQECYKFISQPQPPTILVLIADQSPSNARTSYWTTFFNKMSAFNIGPEKIAMKKNWPVFFYQVIRKKRGHYEVHFHQLAENPANLKKGEITAKFRDALERTIKEQPEAWLWSHRRWKKEMPEGVQII